MDCEELELWKVAQEISLYFDKNVVVYDDVKGKKISCNLRRLEFEKSLDLIAWLAGVEWYEKDSIFYIGGNKDYIEVLDNTGIDKSVISVFSGSSVKIVEDKIIVSGTEREVKRISEAILKLQSKKYISVRLWGYEISEDKALKLGIDIDKSIAYAASWENLITNGYNPIQSLVVSLAMSVEAEQNSEDLKLLLDTQITLMSGRSNQLFVGDETDRPIYSVNEYGKTYTSGYNTLETGYKLLLSSFVYDSESWLFEVNISNKNEYTELKRANLELKNTVILGKNRPALIGRLIKDGVMVTVDKGIPFLCDIPYLGYIFRVTEERQVRRHVLFFIERLDDADIERLRKRTAGTAVPPGSSAGAVSAPLLGIGETIRHAPFPALFEKEQEKMLIDPEKVLKLNSRSKVTSPNDIKTSEKVP